MGKRSSHPDRTGIAAQGLLLAETFRRDFANVEVRGVVLRKPNLTEPEGPSTMGGLQAEQHITLTPVRSDGRTLTVGTASVPGGRAVLRTFRCLQEMHAQRFGKEPFDLDPAYYQVFFDRARGFFAEQGMGVDLETRTPATLAPPPAPSNTGRNIGIVLVVALAAAAVALWQMQGG